MTAHAYRLRLAHRLTAQLYRRTFKSRCLTSRGPWGDPMRNSSNDRLMQAATELLDYAGGTMNRYQLNKGLFLLDLYHFSETGETFTGVTYLAYEHGPVVQDYKERLIRPLCQQNIAFEPQHDQERDGQWKSLILVRRSEGAPPVVLERLGRRAIDHLHDPRFDVEGFMHANPGWRAARARGPLEPIDMLLAYQHIAPRDGWLDEQPTLEEGEEMRRGYADATFWE